MAIEKYTNNATSTLNGAINNSVTSLAVTSASTFPASGNFRILIDSEIMLVTAVSSNTFTVTRAHENTAAASHSDGATVTHVFTAGAINAVRGDQISRGTAASRPTAGVSGNLYFPTDDFVVNQDNGSTYMSFGPVFKFTPPVDADFAWINQGSASVVATANTIRLNSPSGDTSFNYRIRKKAAPSAPYTITAAFLWQIKNNNTNAVCGICFRQSSDGKVIGGGPFQIDNNGRRIVVFKMNSPTSFNATYINDTQSEGCGIQWLQMSDDNTNRIWRWSNNGLDWIQLASESRTTFMTADEVGFFTNHDSTGMTLLSWEQT